MADQYTDNIMMDTAPPTQENSIDLAGAEEAMTGVPPQIASKRASIANYGLEGIFPKPAEYIRDQITRGNEQGVRQEAASTLDQSKAIDKQQHVQEIASQPLTTDSKTKLFDLINKPLKPTDPNTVFEDTTALKYVNSVYTVNSNPSEPKFTWLQEVLGTIPSTLQDTTDLAAEATSKYLYWQNKSDEARTKLSEQPLIGLSSNPIDYLSPFGVNAIKGRIPDLLKQFTFFYPEAMLRGRVDETGFFEGGLKGGNLAAQRAKLYSFDYDTMKEKSEAIMAKLYQQDPSMAAEFAEAMVGQTLDQHTLNNLFTLAVPFEALQGANIMYKATRQLGKNLVMTAPAFHVQPPSVAAATGVGDLGEAAVQRVALNTVMDLSGHTPETKRAIESLTSNFKIIDDQIHANPGNYGTAGANTLTQTLEAGRNNIVEAITTAQRVNRTPVATSSEDVIRMTKDYIRGEHKGLDNSILDVKGPFHEPVSNVPYYDIHIGTSDKEFFKDWQTAQGFAKLNNITLRPTISQEFNRINQAISAARRAGADVKPIQAERAAFQERYKAELGKTSERPILPNTEGATVENENSGAGFYIRIPVYNPEKIDVVRNTLITPEAPNMSAYKTEMRSGSVSTSLPPYAKYMPEALGSALSRIRSPKDILSVQENISRQLVDQGPKRLKQLMEKEAKSIESLPKLFGWQKDFERTLTFTQKKIDPDSGLPGYFFKSPAELEYHYMQYYKRLPQPAEINAYFSYVKLMEYDRVLREMSSFRNRAVNNVEQVQFHAGDTPSGFFEAIRHPNFPGGDGTIAFINKSGKVEFGAADTLGNKPKKFAEKQRKAFEAGETEVWKIWNTDSKPLKNLGDIFADKHVEYVIVPKGSETKPISWNTIPRRGGGHLTPDYEFYIKQPMVTREAVDIGKGEIRIRDIYHGDRTVMPIDIRRKGLDVSKGMNEVRAALSRGDEAAARQAHLDHQLPMDWDEHRGWYKEGRSPSGDKLEPRLSLKHEISVVPKDLMIADVSSKFEKSFQYLDKEGNVGTTFKNGVKGGNPSRLATVEFTGQRDAYELSTIGDGGRGATKNPLYSYQPANYIDPITAMDRGLAKIVNSTYMDDYKMFVAEHWLQQAWLKNALDVKGGLPELRNNMLYYFHNPEYKKGLMRSDPALWNQLATTHARAMDFIGRSSMWDSWTHKATTTIADSIYGATTSSKLAIVPYQMLPFVRSPISFMRSWVSSLNLGYFNPRSYFNQLGTFVNIAAIAPMHAPRATFATILYGASKINRSEEILNYMDKLASKMGYKPGQWKEATKLMLDGGINIVGSEHAFLDTQLNVNLAKTWFQKFNAAGMKPFEWGSKTTKVASWYIAYQEFRELNPLRTITQQDIGNMLNRASTLDHNMTRSANSILHTGYMAVPGQFQSYSIRTSELLFGKQITPMAKMRLATAAGLMYGIPVGVLGSYGLASNDYIHKNMYDKGVPIGGPLGDYMQKTLGTQPYVIGDNLMVTTAMEGLMSVMLATITGGGNPRKGTWYDTSRFASKGIDLVTNALSDKTLMDVLGNMLVSTGKNVAVQSSGIMRWMSNIVNPEESKKYELTAQDFKDLANIVNQGDALRELITSLNIGKDISRTGTYLGNVTQSEAWVKHILGITPIQLQTFQKSQIDKATRDNEDAAGKEMARQFTRFLINDETGNKSEATINYRNMMKLMDIADVRSDRRMHFLEQAMQGQTSQYLRVNLDFYTKYSKDKDTDSKMMALQKELQMRGQK